MRRTSLLSRWVARSKRLVTSEYLPVDHLQRFLREVATLRTVVELGSGSRRLGPKLINIDLFGFAEVDVVADIQRLPLADGSVDAVILENVLEHVSDAQGVIAEVHRVLTPGGRVFCHAPFIFPYHGYPAHYANFSREGLQQLFHGFHHVEIAPGLGPSSALVNLLSEYVAVAFSRGAVDKQRYTLFKGAALLPLFPLKYLDRLWVNAPGTHRLAGTLCLVATR